LGVNGWGGWGDARLNPPMERGSNRIIRRARIDARPAAGGSGNHKGAFANSNLNVIIEGDTIYTIKLMCISRILPDRRRAPVSRRTG
jgi:hypothetical protein